MRICGELVHFHAGVAGESELSISGGDQVLELLLGHALAQRAVNGFVRTQRNLCRQTHERDFVSALDHAAARSHWSSTRKRELRRGFGDPICEEESNRFFDS